MTSPTVGTGIAAFIEARLAVREALARKLGMRLQRVLLAEVAKGRAILALHQSNNLSLAAFWDCTECDKPWPCQTVRLLAAIDADHPDYDPDWKPVAT